MKALGTYGGSSFNGSGAPARSPRRASARPWKSTICIDGGRLGISSDWIGGRCAPTQATTPAPPIATQRPTTSVQYAKRPISARLPRGGFDLRGRALRRLAGGPLFVGGRSPFGAGRSSAETRRSGLL